MDSSGLLLVFLKKKWEVKGLKLKEVTNLSTHFHFKFHITTFSQLTKTYFILNLSRGALVSFGGKCLS